ncbi:MAG: hypothetical protein Q8M15_02290 [Bacteroidota bacterium]|nr:hypothetical protein [Bacteroidota bacterium]
MKTLNKFLLTSLLILANLNVFGTVWHVSNVAGFLADFNTIQGAYNAALAGDTIYLYGSSVGYGDLYLTKKLTIIGPGYFLVQNPQTQSNYTAASLNVIYFRPNSGGSVIMGLNIGQVVIRTSNITVSRNLLNNGIMVNDSQNSSISNIIINQNYVAGGYVQTYSGNATYVNVTNNIIIGALYLNTGSNYTVINNYITGVVYMKNGSFKNNIHSNYNISTGSSGSTFNNTLIQNNIYSGRTYSNGSAEVSIDTLLNKVNIISMANVFMLTGSTDGKYQLKTGSPAIGFANGGGDSGPFGGPSAYILSGMANIPAVYELNVPPSGGSNLNIIIKAKSHL